MAAIASVVNGLLENTSVKINKIIDICEYVILINKMRNLANAFSHGWAVLTVRIFRATTIEKIGLFLTLLFSSEILDLGST